LTNLEGRKGGGKSTSLHDHEGGKKGASIGGYHAYTRCSGPKGTGRNIPTTTRQHAEDSSWMPEMLLK